MFPEQLISSRNLQTLLVTSCFFFFFFWRCLLCLLVYSFLFLTVLGLHCCVQPLLAVRRGYSFSVAVCGLTAVASLAAEHVLWVCGLRSCGTWALAAPWHVGSSQTRDRTCFPCTGRQILIHWSTREFSTPCPFHTYLWLSAVSLLTVWALLSASRTCEGIPPLAGTLVCGTYADLQTTLHSLCLDGVQSRDVFSAITAVSRHIYSNGFRS